MRLVTRKRQRENVAAKALHCLLDLLAPAQRIGHFVQPVQQHQTAAFEQLFPETGA